jgi:sulfite reductase (NADPH) flavoprotein alpha-component
MDYATLSEGSRQWPCAPEGGESKAIRYLVQEDGRTSVRFATDSGRANFFARPCLPPAEMPDAEYPFALTNGRLAHQWHTLTKTGKVPTLNKLNPGAFVEINPEDATRMEVENGSLIKVGSRRGFAIYPAVITDRVRPGDCFAPIHWNDQYGENLCVNAATNDACDTFSLQPEFKFSAVALVKVQIDAAGGFTPEQQQILCGLMSGLARHYEVNGHGAPVLPESAPFTAGQRRQLNELFARLGDVDSKIEKKP